MRDGALKQITLLGVDAAVNLALGILLLVFPRQLVELIGIPSAVSAFYPSLLGAVLFGIGIALLITRFQPTLGGLGLGGAIAINLSGGLVLAIWLVVGGLALPTRGYILLWLLVLVLFGISAMEALSQRRRNDRIV
jgi:hypothetical protein